MNAVDGKTPGVPSEDELPERLFAAKIRSRGCRSSRIGSRRPLDGEFR
jgi:hypothetical protein